MGRIRSIKPELPLSENLGRCSRDARLLFVLLFTICDDSGTTRGASRMLASLLFPFDDDAPEKIDGWLTEIEREGCIARYEVEGVHYLQVCNWLKHQKIDHASPSKLPQFTESSRVLAKPREASLPDLDLGSRIKDQKSREAEASLVRQAARFEDFWTVYPIKRGKKTAHAKWVSKRLDAKADDLIADVVNRTKHDEQWLRGFAPHPSTYLHQERWQDELKGRREPPRPISKSAQALNTIERLKHGHAELDLEPNATPDVPRIGRATRG